MTAGSRSSASVEKMTMMHRDMARLGWLGRAGASGHRRTWLAGPRGKLADGKEAAVVLGCCMRGLGRGVSG